ncbi:hypothetical protein GPECTOR_45g130 [Gonium pectorale]|uniref:Uncharacterized protein n=1 Tax=Gonium pectorale TaxID=33097 RepID=A0A150GA85_GONPE|nr:hypothetical protein GPECTOR_45g130 [Gonium pectorale]|eukprot:KXZ46260.1 hypothetical protein GPECTOR_45g130 [Gonium pectorale]
MGGTQGVGAGTANNPFWELYDPADDILRAFAMRPAYLDSAEQVYYPFNYVLPSGLLFTFCGRTGWIMDWRTNTWRQDVPRLRGCCNTQFPFTGTSVMLGLYPERGYQVEVMLFGGAREMAIRDLTQISNINANRLVLTFDETTRNYTFQGWAEERMLAARVMPDATLLPNGKVVIMSGARLGLAGDSAGGGDSRANQPVLFAEEYNPDAPPGARFSRMGTTRIARMYHSVAALTTNGTILVAGCDRCYKFEVLPGVSFSPSPTSKAEYRVEIFSPPYFFMDELKPSIASVQSSTMPYAAPYTITYTFPPAAEGAPGPLRLTRVVLVAPSSTTHSFNMHQRLVGLEILADSTEDGVVTVRGPPDIYIAPPGMYMLFLLNGDVYSRAAWVTLVRPPPGEPGWMP